MTELNLYKFINENNIEWHYEQDGIYMFVSFYLLKEFTAMIRTYLSDSVFEVVLKDTYICLKINEICEYFDININNIFNKDK
jgi:predicted CDP-diglyceride synthetase/phosphatidate cytidylyltransferase